MLYIEACLLEKSFGMQLDTTITNMSKSYKLICII